MRKRIANPDQSAEVDMTPMLDIVFIMLIFFIVTTTFVKESAIVIDRPSKNPDKTDTIIPTALVVEINQLEDVSIAGRVIQKESVRANIEASLSNNRELVVLVKIAETAGSGILVEVVDQIKLAGIAQVSVSRVTAS